VTDLPATRLFCRIVRTDPPTEADFLPYEALGGAPPDDPYLRRLWQGLSVYDTETRARNRALRQPPSAGTSRSFACSGRLPFGLSARAIVVGITRFGASRQRSLRV
jgi:hypothetical protein